MSESTYTEHVERHGATYQPKMRKIHDMSDDCYRWNVLVRPANTPADADVGVDVSLIIAESQAYGDGEEGMNFSLDMVEYGGLIVGGCTPFNYSSDVWVDVADNDAVETRWTLFTQCFDAGAVMDGIERHYAR
jgi:hypothetical protein